MDTWLIVVIALAVVAIGALFIPLRLRLRLQGRGDPGGAWALAGAAQVGPVIASGVAARGVVATLRVHVFNRALYERTLGELLAKKDEEEEEEKTPKERVEEAIDRLGDAHRRLPAQNLLLFVSRERRRIRIELIEVDLGYSFVDIALTGKLLGAIYALSAVLPRQIVVRQRASWDSKDQGEVAASGSIRIWPGLLLVDSLLFLIRNVKTLVFARRAREAI